MIRAQYAPLFVKSAGVTVALTFASMAVAMLIGLLVAVCRLYGPKPLQLQGCRPFSPPVAVIAERPVPWFIPSVRFDQRRVTAT